LNIGIVMDTPELLAMIEARRLELAMTRDR